MSEKRRADLIINFQHGREVAGRLEIFRKSQWTGEARDRYMYRLRFDSKWLNGVHGERQYVAKDELIPVLMQRLAAEDVI